MRNHLSVCLSSCTPFLVASLVSRLLDESETMTPRPLEVSWGVLTAVLESLSRIQSLSQHPLEVCGEEKSRSLCLLFQLHDRPSDVFCLVGMYRNPKALIHPTDRNDPRGLRLKPSTRTYPTPKKKCAVAYLLWICIPPHHCRYLLQLSLVVFFVCLHSLCCFGFRTFS
jgi:hypothetical protein